MTLQFLDSRLSEHNNGSSSTEVVSTGGVFDLIGDIGLQMTSVLAINIDKVRVSLNGTVGVSQWRDTTYPAKGYGSDDLDVGPYIIGGFTNSYWHKAILKITIERGGTGVQGTGITILEEEVILETTQLDISVTGSDFVPPAFVILGEVRYTMFITNLTQYSKVTLNGPVVFNGVASAGTT